MNKSCILISMGVVGLSVAVGWFARGMMGADGSPPMGMMQMPPAAVNAIEVTESLLAPVGEYIAHVEPLQDVVIRPEVSGTIKEIHFTEGSYVEEGDLLFTIDQAIYKADAAAAEAELFRAEKRYERLKNVDKRSVSASDLESAESDYLRTKALLELANTQLGYTQVNAPFSGRIGAAMVKKGNYVSSATDGLARIVQLDPIRVVFSQTDREYLAQRRRELSGDSAAFEARVVLPDGSALPNIGKKDFDDNAINPESGTIAVRYLFENPDNLLLPGGYVNAQLSNPAGEKGIKIPQRAVMVGQQGPYVMSVDEAGLVGVVPVQTEAQMGAEIIIGSGLKPGDRVIVDGLQKARPGATVQVRLVEAGQ